MEYKYTLKINGMMCGMCEAHINDVVRKNFDVKKVSSSHLKKQTIILTTQEIEEELIKDKINQTGYTVEDIKKETTEEKKGFFARLFKK